MTGTPGTMPWSRPDADPVADIRRFCREAVEAPTDHVDRVEQIETFWRLAAVRHRTPARLRAYRRRHLNRIRKSRRS
jgi:hypothetical protein